MVRLVLGLTMNLLGLSVLLTLAGIVHCQEVSQRQEYCRYELEEIEKTLNSSGNVNDFVVNCVVHNGTRAQSISISVFSDNDSMRYDFQCVGGTTLIPTLSELASNVSNPACSSCNFTAEDPCVGRCGELCGSCTEGNSSNCLTCRYLERVEENAHDGVCLNRSSCEMLHFTPTEEGCECDGLLRLYELHEGDPQYLLPNEEYTYECVSDCNSPDVAREEEGICEVCGVEKCVKCTGSSGQCEECVHEYEVTGEGGARTECVTEEEAKRLEEEAERLELEEELRHLTEELIHEQEEEEEAREDTELHLQILLPIFCILTVLVFFILSVIAHYWYPYTDQEGKKRSRTKPTEEEQPTVWRPRPTIRFR